LSPPALQLVGLGYGGKGNLTADTLAALKAAEKVFYLVSEPMAALVLRRLVPSAESLHDCYREGEPGARASRRMEGRILEALRSGQRVVAAFSGHPAVYCGPVLPVLAAARSQAFPAQILPGVSCLDWLLADCCDLLGVWPGRSVYEATDFLLRPRRFDLGLPLILLQPGVVGVQAFRAGEAGDRPGLEILAAALLGHYPPRQRVVLYEAATLPTSTATRREVALEDLARTPITVTTTLVVLPELFCARI
jgi:Tetrapyrrole (Corrin/Porphyrin) Methylases